MELEALRSIYEGDESFRELSPVSFQYRVRHGVSGSTYYFARKDSRLLKMLIFFFKSSGLTLLCLWIF